MDEGDDVDIYAGVGDSDKNITEFSYVQLVDMCQKLKEDLEQTQARLNEASKKNESLVQENDLLKKQNVALTKNISSLFKTAQIEVQRKTKEIQQLRTNVPNTAVSKS